MSYDMRGSSNPNFKHGKRYESIYESWSGMKNRCNNPN